MPIGLIALALGGFGIGLTEFVIMGLLPEVAADFRRQRGHRGLADLRLRARRRGRSTAAHRRGDPLRAQARAGRPAGAVHRRQPHLRARPRLLDDDDRPHCGRPGPRRVLRHRRGRGRRHGGAHQEGRRHRHHVHRPHRRQRARAFPSAPCWARRPAGAPPSGPSPASASWPSPASWPWCRRPATATPRPGGLRSELRAFRSGQVWLSILVTILGYGGMFGAFTYIAFTLTEVSGFSASTVPWLLIVFGVGPLHRQHARRQGRRPER